MKTWFSITDKAESVEVSIHDEIGAWGISAKDFITSLRSVTPGAPINLSIHSPGGEVFDGWAIYNALKSRPGAVHVKIEGLAASMASVIAMAGDTITMPRNAYLMIHNPMGVAIGESADMRELANLLDKLRDGIVNAYESRTGLSREELVAMMDAETWMDGAEALAKGFITESSDAVALSASAFDTRRFAKMPTNAITPIASSPEAEPSNETGTLEAPPAGEPAPKPEGEVVTTDAPTEPEAKGFVERIVAAFSGDAALKKELETVRASLTERDSEVATLKAKVEALQPAADQLALIEAKLREAEANAKSVGLAAAEIAASHGLTPEKLKDLPAPSGEASSVLEQLEAIADPAERTEFFRKNKAALNTAYVATKKNK